MPNQSSSQPTPASSGVIAPDFEHFLSSIQATVGNDPEQIRTAKAVFYSGYLCCYNRLVTSLRNPQEAVLITSTMRDELNKFFTGEL